MKPRHAYHTHWCTLFEFHLKRKRMSVSEFSRLAKLSQQSVHGYYVGKVRPPIERVPMFAEVLGLRGSELAQFQLAAWEAWTPEVVWKRLMDCEQRKAPERTPSQTEQDLLMSQAVIAKLLDILRRVEELFYTRSVAMHKIRETRELLGGEIRRAIEHHSVAP